MENKYVGVDFDGTVVRHEYPKIGEEVPGAVQVIKKLIEQKNQIILWTMRDGNELDDAVQWFKDRDIELFGINRNPDQFWSDSPKAYCHVYIDDAAFGCPIIVPETGRPFVDWLQVEQALIISEKF